MHSNDVIHGDTECSNILIQQNGSLAVANFSGSAIDGSMAQVGYAARIQCPQQKTLVRIQ